MILRYLDYDLLDIEKELEKIKNANYAEIVIDQNNKVCLFILGMLFVNGIKIKILNKDNLNLENTYKSFSLMSYVWDKLGDDNFPNKDYSNVITELDNKIDNIKRLGIKVSNINNNEEDNKIFLICPVRNASNEQREWIENYVKEKTLEGYIIHAPHLHTRQVDLFGGYSICKQNAEAVANSKEIHIYYDKYSTGSVFDLGASYALEKPLVLLNENEVKLDEKDIVDSVIKSWPYNNKLKIKTKKPFH